jgi:hypothetical protein
MAHWKLTVFTDVWVQTDYVHIVDPFTLFGSVPRLELFGSTAAQGIPNINGRVLHIGV